MTEHERRAPRELWFERIFGWMCLAAIVLPLLVLFVLVGDVVMDGARRLDWNFLTGFPSRDPARAGILVGVIGSLTLVGLTAAIALPLGVGAAIWLEEYRNRGRLASLIEINIANLAGVPSVIYGLLGLEIFARTLGLGRSVFAGALTMALLVLPVVIMASREALRGVPHELREAGLALGASKWSVIKRVVVPAAAPGILTGTILSVARALGEAAPLVVLGAVTYLSFVPVCPSDPFTVLPIQIFNWVARPQVGFVENASAGILVLMLLLLLLNGAAIWLRDRQRHR